MIRITALYANTPGSRFDAAYYLERHTPFALRLLGPHGLTNIRTTIGTAALDGSPPPFWTISEMLFVDRAAFDAAMAACGPELFADIANYTDTAPVLQVSDLQEA